jgi:hypothetical protein
VANIILFILSILLAAAAIYFAEDATQHPNLYLRLLSYASVYVALLVAWTVGIEILWEGINRDG